jgi:hypothetical protein
MTSILIRASLLAVALGIAAPANAGLSGDFSGCDGLKKPKNSDDGMRGQATVPSYRFGADGPSSTLAACNRVLESKKLLPEQTLRLAHIMRARAAAKLELDDTDGALADLDSAEAAGKQYEGDAAYDRSMGVSLKMLRAIALSGKGDKAAAIALAEAVATKRPYALQLLSAATMVQSANGENPSDAAIWRDLLRLDPAVRNFYAEMAAKPDDFATIAAKAGPPDVISLDVKGSLPNLGSGGDVGRLITELSAPVTRAMNTAYALAATGKPEAAREWVAATRKAVEPEKQKPDDTAAKDANKKDADKKPADKGPMDIGELFLPIVKSSSFDPMATVIDARIAISENRLADAFALVKDMKLRSTPVTEELYAAYAAASTKAEASLVELPKLTPASPRGPARLASMAGGLLIPPELQGKQIDYKKSRPDVVGALVGAAFSMGTSLLGGVERTTGFRSTPNADGSIKVEYTGNTTSGPVVQEMTLLRAAELTREAKKPRFQVILRNDYQRYMAMTQYGVETERTLVGYKTELNIRFLSAEDSEENALDAEEIIKALGPVYYDSVEQKGETKKSN